MLALLLTACTSVAGSIPRASTPVPTAAPFARPTPRPVVFPRDDAPHEDLTEWWYYTGHLFGPAGERFGFELVVFQALRRGSPVGYAAHFAVTDHQNRRFRYDERTSIGSQIGSTEGFDLRVGDWRMRGALGNDELSAAMLGYRIELALRASKPPVLHRGIGLISFGPAGDSYYYSRTRMDVRGTIEVEGRPVAVSGLAWMDHQWGDFLSAGGGWDWFAVQLEDGRDLTVSLVRDDDGRIVLAYGTLVEPDGTSRHLGDEEFRATATGEWRSPRTGVTYPSGWVIEVPGGALALLLEPVMADQELETQESTGVTYWEGEVDVRARPGGPIVGHGYVELTGYRAR